MLKTGVHPIFNMFKRWTSTHLNQSKSKLKITLLCFLTLGGGYYPKLVATDVNALDLTQYTKYWVMVIEIT